MLWNVNLSLIAESPVNRKKLRNIHRLLCPDPLAVFDGVECLWRQNNKAAQFSFLQRLWSLVSCSLLFQSCNPTCLAHPSWIPGGSSRECLTAVVQQIFVWPLLPSSRPCGTHVKACGTRDGQKNWTEIIHNKKWYCLTKTLVILG